MFKEGDFVKVKPNVVLKSGDITDANWGGEIFEIHKAGRMCLVSLDAITIDLLSERFLRHQIQLEIEPFYYAFAIEDLILSEERDTYEQQMAALENLGKRVIEIERQLINDRLFAIEQLFYEFEKSSAYAEFNPAQKTDAHFVVYSFSKMMLRYTNALPQDWLPKDVLKIYVDSVPYNVAAPLSTFEYYDTILSCFFHYLQQEGHLKNALQLTEVLEGRKITFLRNIRNDNNWSIKKEILMKRQERALDAEEAIDDNDPEVLKGEESILEAMKAITATRQPEQKSYKGIGRNEKVTVKYSDGRIVESIKFKKALPDLKAGLCVLVE